MMKYLSVCSGIEAASVAFRPLGWEALAFSEIEAFPRAVLQHHYPGVPLYGDFTELKDMPFIADADLLCGGTPCQSFSVAGLRKGLDDDRGNLTLQFVLLADAIDTLRLAAGREPGWILWENVPGIFSDKGNAFGSFLGGLCGHDSAIPKPSGGWPAAGVVDGPSRVAAWRVLDAQYFGLAQRRKRVFVLAKGGAGRWAAADALLPIIESSRWHPAPRRGAGEGTAGGAEGGAGVGVEGVVTPEVAGTIGTRGNKSHTELDGHGAHVVFDPAQVTSKTNRSNPQPGDPCHTLHSHDAPMLVRMREGKEGGGKGPLVSNDQSLTLATANDQVLAVALRGRDGGGTAEVSDISSALRASQGGGDKAHAIQGLQVRRLTPVECERLQGFPDGYTNIPWRGKPESPDGPRYKALGNSWAVPVVRWIGEQINKVTNPK